MNSIKSFALATVITAISFSSFAAEKIAHADSSLEKIATISVFGLGTPGEVEQQLSKKADALGASKYKVVMTSSNDNTERGTAVIYK